jgi:hypothetical protein
MVITPKQRHLLVFFASPIGRRVPDCGEVKEFGRSRCCLSLGAGIGLINVMGIVMKKMVLVAATLAMTAGSAFAADMPVKAVRAPLPPPFEPWDFAFGR